MRSIASASTPVASRTCTSGSVSGVESGTAFKYAHIVDLEHVLIVGAGQMGGGIAQVVAASGRRVSLLDPAPGAVERAFEAMRRSLTKLGADADATIARIEPVTELVPA